MMVMIGLTYQRDISVNTSIDNAITVIIITIAPVLPVTGLIVVDIAA